MYPEEEDIIIVAHVEDMVFSMVEMMIRSLVLGQALGTEVQKDSVAAMEKNEGGDGQVIKFPKGDPRGDGCLGRGVASSQG